MAAKFILIGSGQQPGKISQPRRRAARQGQDPDSF